MCSKCSAVNYHTVLLAFAWTVSPTASPKSSEKRASSRRPENGQRLAGNVGNTEVMCESDAQIVSTKNRLGAVHSAAQVPCEKLRHPWLRSLYTAICSLNAATDWL